MPLPHPFNLKNWIMIKNVLSSFPKYFPLKFTIKNLKSRRVKMIEVLIEVTSTSFAFKTFFQILPTQKHFTHLVSRINKKAPYPSNELINCLVLHP